MGGRGGRDFLVWASGRLACDTAIGVMEIRVATTSSNGRKPPALPGAGPGAAGRGRGRHVTWRIGPVESGCSAISMRTSVGCVGCEGSAGSVPAKDLLEGPLHRLPLQLVFDIELRDI